MSTIPEVILPIVYAFLGIIFIPVAFLVLLPVIAYFIRKFFYFSLSPKLVAMIVKVGSNDETNFKCVISYLLEFME